MKTTCIAALPAGAERPAASGLEHSTHSPDSEWETKRRTGPISATERYALARLFEMLPRPLWSLQAITDTPEHLSLQFQRGCCELELRGWLRITGRRRPGYAAWALTARFYREATQFPTEDSRRQWAAEVAAEVKAAMNAATTAEPTAAEQARRMGPLLAIIGWDAFHCEEVVNGHRHSQQTLFGRLLSLAQNHGMTERDADRLTTMSKAGKDVNAAAFRLAKEACQDLPLADFKAILQRSGAAGLLMRPDASFH